MLDEIPTDFEADADAALTTALTSSRLMLLGETHGVQENPAIIYTLFRRFHFSALALEWPPGLNLRSPTVSADGRVTLGHFELLGQLQRDGLLAHVILFDSAGDGTWTGRDRAMATRLLEGLRQGLTTLVVAGNLHTATHHLPYGHPMGEYVAAQVPNVPTGRIRYLGGQYYNFGIKKFRRRLWHRRQRARFYLKEGEFIFELPLAHAIAVD